ncbi:MAG: hypothetical protein AABW89_04425 [Nanoarchaeota archaeon]
MQLSKNEEKVYSSLKNSKMQVFRSRDIRLLRGINKTKTYNLIKALKRKKVITALSSGIYVMKDTDEFTAGVHFNWPSYVSFLSALNYYGFSDNLPRKITFVSTRYKKSLLFEYACLSKNRFFGYKKEGEIIVAEKEKAIVDSLLLPKYAGGIKEISKGLTEKFNELDSKKLLDYAFRVGSKMVLRRLGFILEKRLAKKDEISLLNKIGKGVGFLDPSIKKRNNLNKKWLLYTDLG